jgi:hypothetical protein
MTATLTLTEQRQQHETARTKALEEFATVDACRPAVALDGGPAALEEVDSERARLQVAADRHDLALAEITRREELERVALAERSRKVLAKQLDATLAGRMRHTAVAATLAEQLRAAVGTILEDERFIFELARRVGVEDSVRSVVPTLRNVVVGRLAALPDLLPRSRPRDLERHERLLADLLAMKPV